MNSWVSLRYGRRLEGSLRKEKEQGKKGNGKRVNQGGINYDEGGD